MQKLEKIIVENVFKEKEPKTQFLKGNIKSAYLSKYAKIIRDLSDSYVENKKDGIALKMKERDFIEAYALYYLPINFYKISFLLSKIPSIIFKDKQSVNFLDYGSGPATGAIAVSEFCEKLNINLRITLYDKSKEMLNLGKKLLKPYKANNILATNNPNDIFKSSFDVITILNVINELEKEDLEDLLLNFDTLLADDGVLIILEPALKISTRKLMDFRNKILEKYQYKILYPCFHDKECQMLNCKNDWCHGELQGLDSRLVNMLDGITGFNKHKIKYSCAVFYKNKKEKFDSYEDYARVVSVPKLSNRGISFTACALDCYKEILISKNELKKNKDLKKLKLLDKFNIKEKRFFTF